MCRALLLLCLFLILTQLACGYTDGGFSVELIHRDSPRSPFHDPSLTPHGRVLAAVRRSVFDLSSSSTYGRVGCQSDSCHSVHGTFCDATSLCQYNYSSGHVSTETFTFDDAPGGERAQLQVPRVNFGCATTANFPGYGMVGLSDGKSSLINQMSAATSLGRWFSYCLAPYLSDASSALNFGSRATVTGPGAVTTPMVHSPVHVEASYTVEIVAVRVENSVKLPNSKRSPVIVDSGSMLTSLDGELLDPIVEALARSIKLPRKQSPNPELFSVCYEADGMKALGKIEHEIQARHAARIAVGLPSDSPEQEEGQEEAEEEEEPGMEIVDIPDQD
uniref:Xylanase inhibitor N-terminal domain-containing protein n=1 Tax=Aegilops tauschii TaxID=37682 RepID=M8BEJ3_AEGTA